MSGRDTRSIGNSRKHPRSDTSFSTSIGSQQVENDELLQEEDEEMDAGLDEEEADDLETGEEEIDDEDDVEDNSVLPSGPNASASTSFSRQQAGKRVRLTLGQKREVVDLAASKKFTHRELAEKFHVGRTTITNICRQEDLIRNETDSADATKKRRKTTKVSYDLRILDECLHKWRMELKVSSPDTKITGTILQQRAMEIATKILGEPNVQLPDKVRLALEKFGASNGWLDGFRTRFGSFSTKQLQSDQHVIKSVEVATRIREIHQSLMDIPPQDIWTCSEFAIAYSTSTSTGGLGELTAQEGVAVDANHGRYTVTLFTSAAGETFDLQVIGMDPNVSQQVELDYPIQYGSSKTGWQVAHTMVTMIKALNTLAKNRKRFFKVILDSAVPHVKAAMILDSQGDQRTYFLYDHLYLYFLPPNFKPPKFHPCHLGLIQTFKARFRYEMIEALFLNYHQWVTSSSTTSQSNTSTTTGKSFHPNQFVQGRSGVKNIFHWLSVALKSLDKMTIQKAWSQSGLLPTKTLASHEFQQLSKNTSLTVADIAQNALNDLQRLVGEVIQHLPEFLALLGVSVPMSSSATGSSSISQQLAISLVELEGNAAATDPGIDEAQIIRSVLQKHGYLPSSSSSSSATTASKRQPPLQHAGATTTTNGENPHEVCPSRDQVQESIDLLKQFARLSKDPLDNRTELIVQLNQLKATTSTAYFQTVLSTTHEV